MQKKNLRISNVRSKQDNKSHEFSADEVFFGLQNQFQFSEQHFYGHFASLQCIGAACSTFGHMGSTIFWKRDALRKFVARSNLRATAPSSQMYFKYIPSFA